MNVVSVSMTYPTATWPARGIFVQRRLEAMSRFMNVRVIAPRPWFPFLAAAPQGATADERLQTRRPAMLYSPGIFKPVDPWFYARVLVREIRAMSRQCRPDLIDAHYEWPDGPATAIAARMLGIPFAITLRGKIVSQSRYAIRRRQMRDMLCSAAVRIAVSRDLAGRAARLMGTGHAVHVISNGIDESIFRPADRAESRLQLGLDPAARYLVSVGYVQALKGFDRLVAILPMVRQRCGDVRLLLVGDEVGEHAYMRRLEGLIAASGLSPYIHRVAHATPTRIAAYLNAADVFALATRSEGWCNAIHEALACGVPVVTTDVGGNRELVRTRDDGRLIPFGNPEALGGAIIESLGISWDRAGIAKRAQRPWQQVGLDVFELFQRVLNRRSSPAIPSPANPSPAPPSPEKAACTLPQ